MAKFETEGYCPNNALMGKTGNIWNQTRERAGYLFPSVVYAYGHTAKEPYFADMISDEEWLLGYTVACDLFILLPKEVENDCKIVVRDLINPILIPKDCTFREGNDNFAVGIRKVPEGVDPLEGDDPHFQRHSFPAPTHHVEVFISQK